MQVSRKIAVLLRRSSSRTGLILRLIVASVAVLLSILLLLSSGPVDVGLTAEGGDASNLQVFVLVNGLISVVVILAFLVARNLVKLFFDRRRGLLGARLRLKLALSLMFLTLVPTGLLFIVASGIITQAFEGLINAQVDSAIDGALEIARNYENLNELRLRSDARAIEDIISRERRISESEVALHERLERERSERRLYSIAFFNRKGVDSEGATSPGEVIAEARAVTSSIDEFAEPPPDAQLLQAPPEEGAIRREREEANEFMRWYSPVEVGTRSATLMVTVLAPPEITHAKSVISDWFQEYEQVKLFRGQLRSGALLTLLLITLVFLFAALWWGFFLAREITGPLLRVIEGTQSVARGNYDVVVTAPGGGDEISVLVQSFNLMTRDLKASRTEGEGQRRFIESALAHLGVGVIGVTPEGQISLANERARSILGTSEAIPGKALMQALPVDMRDSCLEIVQQLRAEDPEVLKGTVERELHLRRGGGERRIVVTGSHLKGRGRHEVVLTFDDVTELSQAQALFAWREVARRIAHEIKNPLTPIQLSAQRLERLVANTPMKDQVGDVVQTIVHNVESIKRLANEFSKFARMPSAELQVASINELVDDLTRSYADSHGSLSWQVELDRTLPAFLFDRDQIRRALINLIENAIQVQQTSLDSTTEQKRIAVSTEYDLQKRVARVSVSDNGPGVPEAIWGRLFEPYVTMRPGGTGLGLSIVQSIVADHEGSVRHEVIQPHGARFIIEIPVRLAGALTSGSQVGSLGRTVGMLPQDDQKDKVLSADSSGAELGSSDSIAEKKKQEID